MTAPHTPRHRRPPAIPRPLLAVVIVLAVIAGTCYALGLVNLTSHVKATAPQPTRSAPTYRTPNPPGDTGYADTTPTPTASVPPSEAEPPAGDVPGVRAWTGDTATPRPPAYPQSSGTSSPVAESPNTAGGDGAWSPDPVGTGAPAATPNPSPATDPVTPQPTPTPSPTPGDPVCDLLPWVCGVLP